jgi:hypothetical protein
MITIVVFITLIKINLYNHKFYSEQIGVRLLYYHRLQRINSNTYSTRLLNRIKNIYIS